MVYANEIFVALSATDTVTTPAASRGGVRALMMVASMSDTIRATAVAGADPKKTAGKGDVAFGTRSPETVMRVSMPPACVFVCVYVYVYKYECMYVCVCMLRLGRAVWRR